MAKTDLPLPEHSSSTTSQSIEQFAAELCLGPNGTLGKVERKFVANMLSGVTRARSVNLTDIARALDESINLHATHKRLSRNLDNVSLLDHLSERLLALGSATVGKDTRLVLDVYDLNKRYARKIEYLSQPESDAQGNTLEQGGFKVCEVLASEPGSESYLPLLAHVWSDQVPGFVSDHEEIRTAVARVFHATSGRGLLCLNHKAGEPDTLQNLLLADPKIDLIAMSYGDTAVAQGTDSCTTAELLDQIERPYGKVMFKLVPEGIVGDSKTDVDIFLEFGAKAMKLAGNPRPLTMIAMKTRSTFRNEEDIPVVTSRTNVRSRNTLMGLVENLMSAQDVLASHLERRSVFSPENFRVLGFTRLRLLLTVLQAVIFYEAPSWVSTVPRTIDLAPHDGELERTYLMPADAV